MEGDRIWTQDPGLTLGGQGRPAPSGSGLLGLAVLVAILAGWAVLS